MDAIEVISTKRDGGRLNDDRVDWVIRAYTDGVVVDEQMSALAMTILLSGMDRDEVSCWTAAIIASGQRMDFSSLGRPTADKYSTSGVDDKITLPLTPLVAAFGVAVPRLSERGLGHTGGTLNKMESTPSWCTALDNEELLAQLADVRAVVCTAGSGLAPADKKFYALRDAIGIVEAIPLIASSIMNEKIAKGTRVLVLDVKAGSGAFMKIRDRVEGLTRTMVALGTDAGVNTVALLTNMNTPLSRTTRNTLEVRESLEVLAGDGPCDIIELTMRLAREMLAAAGKPDVDPTSALQDGRAMDVWRRMVAAQGGDPGVPLSVAEHTHVVAAEGDGYIARLDVMAVGVAVWRLGAGRARKEDDMQAAASVEMHTKPGDHITRGALLFTLHTVIPERFKRALEVLDDATTCSGNPVTPDPVILGRIEADVRGNRGPDDDFTRAPALV